MLRTLSLIAGLILAAHGLVHLIGAIVYMKLGTIESLPYKTTVLAGRWDLGGAGTFAFGVLWAVAAVGFIGAATTWLAGWTGWQIVLVAVTLLSLVLTVLDAEVAKFGVLTNLAILASLWLGPKALAGLLG